MTRSSQRLRSLGKSSKHEGPPIEIADDPSPSFENPTLTRDQTPQPEPITPAPLIGQSSTPQTQSRSVVKRVKQRANRNLSSAKKMKVTEEKEKSVLPTSSPSSLKIFRGTLHQQRFESLFSIRKVFHSMTVDWDFLNSHGFSELTDLLKFQGLFSFLSISTPYFDSSIKVLYASFPKEIHDGELAGFVNGKRVTLSSEWLHDTFDLPDAGVTMGSVPSYNNDAARQLIWDSTDVPLSGKIHTTNLPLKSLILHKFIVKALTLRDGSHSTVSSEDVFLMWCILTRTKVNWCEVILRQILKAIKSESSVLVYGHLLSAFMTSELVSQTSESSSMSTDNLNYRYFKLLGYEFSEDTWLLKETSRKGLNLAASAAKATPESKTSPSVSFDDFQQLVLQKLDELNARLDELFDAYKKGEKDMRKG